MDQETKLSRPKSVLIIMLGVMVALLCLSFMIVSATPHKIDREFRKSFKEKKTEHTGIFKSSADTVRDLYKITGFEVFNTNDVKSKKSGKFVVNFSKE